MLGRIGLLMVAAVEIAAMLACTGAAAGAEWQAHPGRGAPIQDVVAGAEADDTIMCMLGHISERGCGRGEADACWPMVLMW